MRGGGVMLRDFHPKDEVGWARGVCLLARIGAWAVDDEAGGWAVGLGLSYDLDGCLSGNMLCGCVMVA